MGDDAIQGMLFAGLGDDLVVDDHLANHELRLCSLNVNSPSPARARRLVGWLLDSGCNVLVLTEMQASQGGELIRTSLDAQGYQVSCTPGWRDNRFHTLVATKGFQVAPVEPGGFDPRVVAVDLTSAAGTIRLVGVYGPTNGMTPDSSGRRRAFQRQLLTYLGVVQRPGLCVTGDLNVVEPDHRPPLPAFEEHDYDFYRGLLALGLRDAYRACHPQGADHSWFSPRYGSQRLDHALIGQGGTLRSCAYQHAPRHQELTDHAALQVVVDLPN
jgi:exodeoxyribonuclease III